MAATDLNTVRSTIEARLATELASSPAIPLVFNNMTFDSTAEDTFVQCITSFGANEYLTQGNSSTATNNVVYAEPVCFGQNLPPSWGGTYRTRQKTVAGFPELIGKELEQYARKEYEKIKRGI